jgi:hypothetical protein
MMLALFSVKYAFYTLLAMQLTFALANSPRYELVY